MALSGNHVLKIQINRKICDEKQATRATPVNQNKGHEQKF